MALSDISLTAGMRNNLLQLQTTASQVSQTQQRLATGKQVNSALDNPTNFFASQAAMNRANDFSTRKDGMGEAIQTVQAANAGITAITALVTAAKGIAEAALGTTVTADRQSFAAQYDSLKSQIDSLATDSSYKGTNLLKGNDLTVNFNEDASSNLKVTAFTATSAGGLSLGATTTTTDWSTGSSATQVTAIQADEKLMDGAISELRGQSKTLAGNLNIITTRQNFTDSMINTLQTGSDNLTLADMNKEGANMLALQTRQSLGTTALSLSSQAAQSVLKLF
jgi:flagellin